MKKKLKVMLKLNGFLLCNNICNKNIKVRFLGSFQEVETLFKLWEVSED